MVGKKLFALLADLSLSERRILLNDAKKSGDKRNAVLVALVSQNPKDQEDFQRTLTSVTRGLMRDGLSEAEQNLKKRRFSDFAIKQIEELKISRFLQNNSKLRSLVLSNVYDKPETADVMEGYLETLGNISSKEQDLDLRNYYLSKSIELKPQSQTVKSVNAWRKLISERAELIESRYKADKAELFDLVSISYLDNGTDYKELVQSHREEEGLNEISLELEKLNAASYKIADARITFNNLDQSLKALREAEELIGPVNNRDTRKLALKRKVTYVEFLLNFHNGGDADNLIGLIDDVLAADRLLNKEDLKILFYRAALAALNGEEHSTLKSLESKVDQDSQYMVDFVKALLHLYKGEYRKAKRLFHEVSYSGNPYVASWGRVADIVINTRLGNDDLVRSLLQRANRHLDKHRNRVYSLNSSAVVLDIVSQEIGLRVPQSRKSGNNDVEKVTVLHRFIYEHLNETAQNKLAG